MNGTRHLFLHYEVIFEGFEDNFCAYHDDFVVKMVKWWREKKEIMKITTQLTEVTKSNVDVAI